MEIDHIIPQSLGGQTEEDNLWLACSLCNDHKSDRIAALDPLRGEIVRLFDPRHQMWSEHFAWAESGERIRRAGHRRSVGPQPPLASQGTAGLDSSGLASAQELSVCLVLSLVGSGGCTPSDGITCPPPNPGSPGRSPAPGARGTWSPGACADT
ncbi:MAG TPA: HNH endonuclease signature motif containing protein [Anaerolineae bacterium]|nr:HNH endonuclease signature motif containing protein [Anaerolineae bacterium]